MSNILKKLIPTDALMETMRRFPASAVCSFILFLIVILNIHDVIDFDDKILARICILLVFGFFWFGLIRLIADGLKWSAKKFNIIAPLGFVVYAGLVFWYAEADLMWLLGLSIPALLLGIGVGPYVKGNDNLSFWFYNRQIWQGVAISILAALIWGGGISAAIASIEYLFEVNIPDELYGDVWAFSLILFAPLYALSWVPERYVFTEDDCHAPPQLSFVINWVLAPLVVFYTAILYAYFVKIGLAGEMPRGQLSYMISAFGAFGALTYLAGWPLYKTGNAGALLTPIMRYFFPLLIIPVAVQGLSIYMRIDQYGFTEQRYLVLLSTFWLAALAVGYTYKKLPLKFITLLAALLFVLAAVGPFSAPEIAQNSQMSRLEAVLIKNNILVNGKIQKTDGEISFDDRVSISSKLDFLRNRDRLDALKPWLNLKDDKVVPYPRDLTEAMGFKFINHYEARSGRRNENIKLSGDPYMSVMDVSGYDIYIQQQYIYVNKRRKDDKPRTWSMSDKKAAGLAVAFYEDDKLYVGLTEDDVAEFDVSAFAMKQRLENPNSEKRTMEMTAQSKNAQLRVILHHINLRRNIDENDQDDTEFELNNFRFSAMIAKR